MTRSTPWNREATPGRLRTGRRFAYRSSVLRSPTLTLANPVPIGVVTGPFSATLLRRIESMSSTGSACPVRSNETTPAWKRSHSIDTPEAARIRRTASVTSGPMPSPGMSVILCVIKDCRSRRALR